MTVIANSSCFTIMFYVIALLFVGLLKSYLVAQLVAANLARRKRRQVVLPPNPDNISVPVSIFNAFVVYIL